MTKKTCLDCVHGDVCENKFSWLDQDDNTKYITCHHFKNKADVVEVVRCEKCKFACFQYNTDKYPFGVYACKKQPAGRAYKKVKGTHFCSYGERKEVTEE